MPSPQTINIIALIITICLLFMIVKDRIFGLLAYTCISFTRPGLHFPFLASIRFEMLVAIILLVILFMSSDRRKLLSINRDPISKNLFIFIVVVVLSMVVSIDFQTAFSRCWEFLKIYVFWLLIIALVRTDKELNLFLWTFAILIVWIGYEPVYNYINQVGMVRDRGDMTYAVSETGRGAGHVALGIYLCQGISFLWYLTVSMKTEKMKIIGVSMIVFCIIAILISGSRGALVGLAVTLMFISCFSKRRFIYFTIGGVIFFIALFSMDEGYIKQMSTILDFGASDTSASSRIDGFRHGIEMMIKRPVLGVGPGCYPVARRLWFGWGLWSHNIYGQLAGDLGLAGIVTWSIFIFTYMKKSMIARQELDPNSWFYQVSTAVLVSNAVCLALGFFAHMLYGYFWYMSAAIVLVIEDIRKRDSLLIS